MWAVASLSNVAHISSKLRKFFHQVQIRLDCSIVASWVGPIANTIRETYRQVLFFDVVGVRKDRPGWRFQCREPTPVLSGYKGTYRCTVLVTGDGVAPDGRKIDVTYNGEWEHLRAVDAGPLDANPR
jgi:hypothetical protein